MKQNILKKTIRISILTLSLFIANCDTINIHSISESNSSDNEVSIERDFNSYKVWNSQGTMLMDNYTYKFADVNGDGKKDIVKIDHMINRDSAFVWLSNGSGFNNSSLWKVNNGMIKTNHTYDLADVNGDGKDDIIQINHHNLGRAYVWLSNGNGFKNYTLWSNNNGMVNTNHTYDVEDVNGDGKADIVQINHHDAGRAYVWLSNGRSFNNYTLWKNNGGMIKTNHTYDVEDVNGDGKADIIQINHYGSGRAYVWLSNGSSFSDYILWSNNNGMIKTNHTYDVEDVNGDGKADVVQINHEGSGRAYVWLSNGNHFNNYSLWSNNNGMIKTNHTYGIDDVTGDGKADVIKINHDRGWAYVWTSK